MNNKNKTTENASEICLLNDSFPPQIDGVANTVINYARVIKEKGGRAIVVTPDNPDANDSGFDYPIIRYPGIDLRDSIGYTAGNPFSLPTRLALQERNIALLHSHCPAMSNLLARSMRETMDVPFILTYHTKFDIDIANIIKLKGIQHGMIRALVDSVSACDELWVVSDGAGKNIQNLGYEGDYIIMPNGVDMPKHRVPYSEIEAAAAEYNIPKDVPVFLFVGRLMWYKGIRIILDALAALKYEQLDFRMIFIGGGSDETDIRKYTSKLRLNDKVIFTGPIHDREKLAAWYCCADLLLFPSTFDTNGLVVREAAACSLASVLIDGSCASEGVTNGTDGLLIQENAASLAVCLARIIDHRDVMAKIGENASENLYYSWEDSIGAAIERYNIVIENYKRGYYKKPHRITDEFFALSGEMVKLFGEIRKIVE